MDDTVPEDWGAAWDEADRVAAWRELCFLRLGAPLPLARELALGAVDVHRYEQLVRSGCEPRLAAKILA